MRKQYPSNMKQVYFDHANTIISLLINLLYNIKLYHNPNTLEQVKSL